MHRRTPFADGGAQAQSKGDGDFIDLEKLAAIGLRRARLIALVTVAGIGFGIVYLVLTPPVYTASTRILIDPDLAKFAQEESPVANRMQIDERVLSEVEILQSAKLARSVVLAEKLQNNESFLNPPKTPFALIKGAAKSLLSFLNPPQEPGRNAPLSEEEAKVRKATALLQKAVSAERVGRSLVLELTVNAHDPVLAGSIARTYADQYLEDQLNANFAATQRAMLWLEGRLDDLRQRSHQAAMDVEKYRAEHGLTVASGELISEQSLSDLNSQLILAEAETANARARYQSFKAIIESGQENAVMNATIPPDQPNSELMNELKSRYLEIINREREISERYGDDHPQAVRLRKEGDELRKRIFHELQQLTETYRREYEVALSREESLRENVGVLAGESSELGQAMVKLRELEQKATALSNLYESYLSRYQEASQQRSLPIAKARVISEAENPTAPSSPRETIVLGLSLVLGLFAGIGAAAFQEFRERFLRTGDDVDEALDLKFLGYLPLVAKADLTAKPETSRKKGDEASGISLVSPMLRLAADWPGSAFAETLRNVRLSADVVLHRPGCKVIGFISVLPGEGKTTVAANFACLLGASGVKTLLIDADLRHPGLSRDLVAGRGKGLVDAAAGYDRWQAAVRVDRSLKLAVLPSPKSRIAHTGELLSGPGMGRLIEEARNLFDYVVVDLPPIGPVVDAKAFEPFADGFVLVTEWGETPRALVRSALDSEQHIAAKTLGVVLNKTNMKLLPRYAGLDGSEKYIGRYDAYYTGKP